jgi:hypothetical protein
MTLAKRGIPLWIPPTQTRFLQSNRDRHWQQHIKQKPVYKLYRRAFVLEFSADRRKIHKDYGVTVLISFQSFVLPLEAAFSHISPCSFAMCMM